MRKPVFPAAATPAIAASPRPETKYKSISWQSVIMIMPAKICGAMVEIWLKIEPCVRSFISASLCLARSWRHSAALCASRLHLFDERRHGRTQASFEKDLVWRLEGPGDQARSMLTEVALSGPNTRPA